VLPHMLPSSSSSITRMSIIANVITVMCVCVCLPEGHPSVIRIEYVVTHRVRDRENKRSLMSTRSVNSDDRQSFCPPRICACFRDIQQLLQRRLINRSFVNQ
jgi:hypothetical protein